MTQCERILRHLQDYGTITSLEAVNEYGCMRLAARIADLKDQGHRITSESTKGKNRYGEITHYSTYKLVLSETDKIEREIQKKRLEIKELERQLQTAVCPICGKTFPKRTNAMYCDNLCPKDASMTCKQYARTRLWYQNMSAIKRKEKNTRSAMAMRVKRNPEDAELAECYKAFLETNKKFKELICMGAYTPEQYEKWLEEQLC